ncbi:MAG: hypothetical protein U5K77_03400 [Candidatus Saccharibacteria bacterium]|nr:hypothetical protein [Candidatus Saccharibacteria bacterium]
MNFFRRSTLDTSSIDEFEEQRLALQPDLYKLAHETAVANGEVVDLFPTEKDPLSHRVIGDYPVAGHVKVVPAAEHRHSVELFDQDQVG